MQTQVRLTRGHADVALDRHGRDGGVRELLQEQVVIALGAAEEFL